MKVRITIEQYDALEWAIEIDGVLWASGNCRSEEDGVAQAIAELAKAGIALNEPTR